MATTKDKILAELEKGGRTTKEMIAVVGGSYASVHTSLRRLTRAGLVVEVTKVDGVRLRESKWLLVSKLNELAAKPNPPSPAPFPQPKKRRTKAIVVVDVSGSMNSYAQDLAKSLNRTLSDLRAEAFRTGDAIDVSLYYFNNYVNSEYAHVDARDVKSEPVKYPNGGTALFDAVSQAINDHLRPERHDEDVAYLLVAITDGQDEHSRDRTGNTMRDLIRRVQGTDRWTVTFQLPPGYKDKFCNTYGIHPGNCTEWERTTLGIERAAELRTASTQSYFANRAVGQNSTKSFYATVDLDKLKTSTVKSQLDDIAGMVKTFQVPGETDIKSFIEVKTGVPYARGSVFYQLTKAEKVQPDKSLLVKEKGKRSIFAGDQARSLLGLPAGVNVKVKPGNLSNFDVFVQSKSVNRKLVRGTTVVHWPLSLQ